MTLSYDERVAAVADQICPNVQFDTKEEAIDFRDSFKLPETAPIPMQIRHMSEHFIVWAEKFKLVQYLNPRAAHRTQVSMLNEAIRLCASRYVTLCELKELAELGTIDRTQMMAPAV